MTITAAQTKYFFEANDHMAIPRPTLLQLQNEGITSVDDLAKFDKETLQHIVDKMRRPDSIIPDPNYVPPAPMPVPAPIVPTVPTPPFIFGAKSQKRLQVACDLVRFYEMVGRLLTAANMQWNPQMKNFAEQWKALTTRKDEDAPETPKISKALPVIKWVETFRNHLYRCLRVSMIHLAYVTRPEVGLAGFFPP